MISRLEETWIEGSAFLRNICFVINTLRFVPSTRPFSVCTYIALCFSNGMLWIGYTLFLSLGSCEVKFAIPICSKFDIRRTYPNGTTALLSVYLCFISRRCTDDIVSSCWLILDNWKWSARPGCRHKKIARFLGVIGVTTLIQTEYFTNTSEKHYCLLQGKC
jgi:hypothetical protein